jgi:hypothetical protein
MPRRYTSSNPVASDFSGEFCVKTSICSAVLVVSVLVAAASRGAELPKGVAVSVWPNVTYDAAVPTTQTVLGFQLGERMATHADVRRYLQALASAAPDRVRLVDYGASWQGRELTFAIISSPANIARLDEIRAGMAALADPRKTSPARAEQLLGNLPAVVWLAYSVHGNEPGTTDGALKTAHHLLAARGDARVADMLTNTVVIINPIQNPDGRERFINSNRSATGLAIDPSPLAAERNEPWPAGRFNHYLFDLNRDWFAQTQPESRAHTQAILQWYPVVLADVHEMGTNTTYFFPPAAPPTNPYLTPAQNANRELIGRNNARWFDAFGRPYFTREVYDLFYPGYGDGWPAHHGSVAMTYEQGSARGLAARRDDGIEFTFASTVESQAITSLSAIEVASQNRAKFLRDFYNYRVSAIELGRRSNERTLVIPTQRDQGTADKMAKLLVRQGIEVGRAPTGFSACGKSFAAGSYVIDSAQPAARMIRVLMDKQVPLDKEFVAEQERLRARDLPDEIYDVTAWSLPLLYNTDVVRCGAAANARLDPVDSEGSPAGVLTNPDARVAFLVPWGDTASARLLVAARRAGIRVKSSDEAFEASGKRYPAGTLIVSRANNSADLADRLREIATVTGARVTGVDDSWVTDGPNFGSSKVVEMTAPRIALAWDDPTDATAAGATRFLLERQFGQPVTIVRSAALGRGDLSAFDVVILPNGDFAARWGKKEAENLAGWVKRGGVLIGLGRAMRFLADPGSKLLSVRREDAAPIDEKDSADADDDSESDDDEREEKPTVAGSVIGDAGAAKKSIQAKRSPPDAVAGVLVRAQVDQEHWLGAGVADTVHVLFTGSDIYTPVKLDAGSNVSRFAAADELLASGYLWEENRKQLAYKPFVVLEEHGRGMVIGFTADPTVRSFVDGLNVLLLNAVYRASAHARPAR